MEEISGTTAGGELAVRTVGIDRPWIWLQSGWRDLRHAPLVSFAYGAAFVAVSFVLTVGLWLLDLLYLLLPLAAGFMFLGPVLAIGLYDVSRQLERDQRPTLAHAIGAWREHAGPVATMGLILVLFQLAWIRTAFLIFALFFGMQPPSWDRLINVVFFTAQGAPFLLVGTALGAVLAVIVFTITAVSIPILLDRDVGVATAVATSVAAVAKNWRVMTGWAALIVIFTAAGLVTFYIGLAVMLPLIGYATWHAYRDLVEPARH
ncbi:MAG TPA: DUF2189 domain-containing protein [Methylomirabilota bacterium]|nr:DUF2189 domain-containing protein [Methylomirabilota bacterium]